MTWEAEAQSSEAVESTTASAALIVSNLCRPYSKSKLSWSPTWAKYCHL